MLLDTITMDPGIVTVIVVILVFVFAFIFERFSKLKKSITEKDLKSVKQDSLIREKDLMNQATLKEKDLLIEKMKADALTNARNIAKEEFEKWKTTELLEYKKVIDKNCSDAATNELLRWIRENERRIRDDAAKRSVAVNFGKVAEHFTPFHNNFKFNSQDARFIGSPIDLILFDGASENEDLITIYFIEVKTGTSQLSSLQRRIKSAVDSRRIEWLLLNPEVM